MGFLLLSRERAAVCCSGRASRCRAQALGARVSVAGSTWAQKLLLAGSRVCAQQLWRAGLVAPQYVASSGTRDQTSVR